MLMTFILDIMVTLFIFQEKKKKKIEKPVSVTKNTMRVRNTRYWEVFQYRLDSTSGTDPCYKV